MLVIPAIDLREGLCVCLYQGLPEEETVFSEDPVEVAQNWEQSGASWLHVVDLDGAFAGRPRNLEVIADIVKSVAIPVQVGGGVRTLETVAELLGLGVARVVLGTVAISQPALVAEAYRRYGEGVVVGIDARQGRVAIEGWATTVPKTALELAREVKECGIDRVIYTDVLRDGTMRGPNLEATRELAQGCGLRVIASGGISSMADVKALLALKECGVEGFIVGRALYTGELKLTELIHLAEARG